MRRVVLTKITSRTATSGVVALCAALGLAACAPTQKTAQEGIEDVYQGLEGQKILVTFPGSASTFVDEIDKTFLQPFADATGTTVVANNQTTGPTQLSTQVESGNVTISMIVTGSGGDGLLAAEQRYLQPLDTSVVPVEDLAQGSYSEFGVDAWTYAAVVAWNTENLEYSGPQPTSVTDIYDTEAFPGKRCLYSYPQYGGTLESALLADGVARQDLYPLDVDRALAKLDTIRDDIVWWESGAQFEQFLSDGTCDMGIYYSGDLYKMITHDDAPFEIAWGDAVLENTVMAIPEGSENAEAGQALIRWIVEHRAEQTELLKKMPYLTVSLAEGDDQVLTDPAIAQWVPGGDNLATAVREDADFYAHNIGDVVERFNDWLIAGK